MITSAEESPGNYVGYSILLVKLVVRDGDSRPTLTMPQLDPSRRALTKVGPKGGMVMVAVLSRSGAERNRNTMGAIMASMLGCVFSMGFRRS